METFDIDKLFKSIFSEDKIYDIKNAFDSKLIEFNLSKTKALRLLNIDKDVFDEIISGTAKQPNLINVVKISEFLNIDLNDFISLVMRNQSKENITSIENARKVTFLVKNFEIKALTKVGFFSASDDVDTMVAKVLDFFGFDSILQYQQQLDEPLYSRAKRNFSDKMKDFWIKSAYQSFKIIDNPNEFNRENLKELIVKIKPYSQDSENGLLTVCKALYNLGVTVVFQNYLSTTRVKGATLIINKKPCIVLTDFNKIYPSLWFTLMHELHHVLFDYDVIETNSFHLTGDNDLFLIEEKADQFARDFLMNEEKFHYIKQYINNSYLVSKFAKENEIHVSIVYFSYSFYQEKLYKNNYHAAFKEYFPICSESVKKLNPISWNEKKLKLASDKIKSILEIKN